MSEDVDVLAKQVAGNWKSFHSFGWHDRPEDADNWCIVYTNNRDSGLVGQSNADEIAKIMEVPEFENDVRAEHHGHWGCGWIDGYAIRCLDACGNATPAFKAWIEIENSLAEYGVLNEEDHSRREYEATIENIENAGRRFLKDEHQVEDEVAILVEEGEAYIAALKQCVFSFSDLPSLPKHNTGFGKLVPENWAGEVFSWFWKHNQSAIESRDDQGGYPNDDEMKECLTDLGWLDRDWYPDEEDDDE